MSQSQVLKAGDLFFTIESRVLRELGERLVREPEIPERLRQVLARSNRWGRIRCEVSYAMTSKYAIALYELICLRANRNHCVEVLSYEHFRDILGVPPGTYDRGLDFRRKVVKPALLEVNGLSDMGVDIDLRRAHARAPIHQIAVSWWRKSGEEFRTAMQERNRSKVGRMARLRGQVEALDSKDASTQNDTPCT